MSSEVPREDLTSSDTIFQVHKYYHLFYVSITNQFQNETVQKKYNNCFNFSVIYHTLSFQEKHGLIIDVSQLYHLQNNL